jgi:hypothetical protein
MRTKPDANRPGSKRKEPQTPAKAKSKPTRKSAAKNPNPPQHPAPVPGDGNQDIVDAEYEVAMPEAGDGSDIKPHGTSGQVKGDLAVKENPGTSEVVKGPTPTGSNNALVAIDIPIERMTPDEIIDYNQESLTLEQRERTINALPPDLQAAIRTIDGYMLAEVTSTLGYRHKMGLVLLAIRENKRNNGKRPYGDRAFEQLVEIYGQKKEVLYGAMRLAEMYSEEEIAQICEMRMSNGEPLTITHLRCLSPVNDPMVRKELLSRAVVFGWTAERLKKEVRKTLPKDEQDGRGRSLKVPMDYDGLLSQIEENADALRRRIAEVWRSVDKGLASKITTLPHEGYTAERRHAVAQVSQTLVCLITDLGRLKDEIEQHLKQFPGSDVAQPQTE